MRKTIFTGLIIFLCLIIINISCSNNNSKNKIINTEIISDSTNITIQEIEEENPIYNSIANILAGKNIDDSINFNTIINDKYFLGYQTNMKNIWNNFYEKHQTIKNWADTNLNKCDTVFYPFGGPDVNYLNSFFPDCKFSLLIGLEKAGRLPFLDSISISNSNEILNTIKTSIQTNIDFSFFRTNSMKNDLSSYIEGTLPVILYFLASYNYKIINIKSALITENGEIETIPFDNNLEIDNKFANGIEIIYKNNEENIYRKLFYFSMDLSDAMINDSCFNKMMKNYFYNKTTFLKAASYLLDRPEFSKVKNIILENTSQIISDPSGMPYKNFDDNWTVSLYGKYVGPIALFSTRVQKDLLDAYQNDNAYPINFKMGYHIASPSFIVAKKK